MKLIQNVFHKMMNKFVELQGCSLMHVGIAKAFDVPVLSVRVGIRAVMNCLILGIDLCSIGNNP